MAHMFLYISNGTLNKCLVPCTITIPTYAVLWLTLLFLDHANIKDHFWNCR